MRNRKPHRGTIEDWFEEPFDKELVRSVYGEDPGLGYFIRGWCIAHPIFGTSSSFHTSWVVKRKGNEIETRNSKYTLGTPRSL